MKRVMILGQPGSGKSTLARALGGITGLPVVHMDMIHWMPGWVERPVPDKLKLALAAHAKERWIFEGGFSKTWDDRLDRCDTLIWLDFPLWLRSWRVFKRTLTGYGQTRPDLPEGCPEQFSLEFWAWIWNTRRTSRDKMGRYFERASDKNRHRLQTRQEVARFVKETEFKYA